MTDVAQLVEHHMAAERRKDEALLKQTMATLRQAMALIDELREELRSTNAEIEQRLTEAHQVGFDLACELHKQGLIETPKQ